MAKSPRSCSLRKALNPKELSQNSLYYSPTFLDENLLFVWKIYRLKWFHIIKVSRYLCYSRIFFNNIGLTCNFAELIQNGDWRRDCRESKPGRQGTIPGELDANVRLG